MKSVPTVLLIAVAMVGTTGCSADAIFAANVTVAAIPCVLMYLTLNIGKRG